MASAGDGGGSGGEATNMSSDVLLPFVLTFMESQSEFALYCRTESEYHPTSARMVLFHLAL